MLHGMNTQQLECSEGWKCKPSEFCPLFKPREIFGRRNFDWWMFSHLALSTCYVGGSTPRTDLPSLTIHTLLKNQDHPSQSLSQLELASRQLLAETCLWQQKLHSLCKFRTGVFSFTWKPDFLSQESWTKRLCCAFRGARSEPSANWIFL